jgi:hypothetical protein
VVIGIYIKGSVAIIRKTSEEGNYSIRDSRNNISLPRTDLAKHKKSVHLFNRGGQCQA